MNKKVAYMLLGLFFSISSFFILAQYECIVSSDVTAPPPLRKYHSLKEIFDNYKILYHYDTACDEMISIQKEDVTKEVLKNFIYEGLSEEYFQKRLRLICNKTEFELIHDNVKAVSYINSKIRIYSLIKKGVSKIVMNYELKRTNIPRGFTSSYSGASQATKFVRKMIEDGLFKFHEKMWLMHSKHLVDLYPEQNKYKSEYEPEAFKIDSWRILPTFGFAIFVLHILILSFLTEKIYHEVNRVGLLQILLVTIFWIKKVWNSIELYPIYLRNKLSFWRN